MLNNSPLIYCTYNIYNTFFSDEKCFFSTTSDMVDLYRLDIIAKENDKIVLINEIQETELFKKGYVFDGYQKSNIDNLNHVFVRKYKLHTEYGKIVSSVI